MASRGPERRPNLTGRFDYDRAAPLLVEERIVEDRPVARIHDLSYGLPDGSRVWAYLVRPGGQGPFAGIVFLHGGGQDRSSFLSEAVRLADLGAASLLVDVPEVRSRPDLTRPERHRDLFRRTIVAVRRGVDLLASCPDVDRHRLGYVGLSYGANLGGLLAGVEDRFQALVLIAGMPSYSRLWGSSPHPAAVQVRQVLTAEQLRRYEEAVAPFDALHYVGRAVPSRLFFQFARDDEIVSGAAARAYVRLVSARPRVGWYEASHAGIQREAVAARDRCAWLRRKLGL